MTSRKGTECVEKIMGSKYFDFSKPVHLIKDLINISTEHNSLILDFFSGSRVIMTEANSSVNKMVLGLLPKLKESVEQ